MMSCLERIFFVLTLKERCYDGATSMSGAHGEVARMILDKTNMILDRQIILEDLQEAAKFILNTRPVVWLVNSSVAVNIGHVLQPAAPQGRLPGGS